jgi:uncharacterized membrane protein SirB2
MLEFYPQIKAVHIAAVIASGSLFALRGAAVQFGAKWAMAAPLRYLSYSIDTVLLTAALMLATSLHQLPFVQGWLTAKVFLLVCYVAIRALCGRCAGSLPCSSISSSSASPARIILSASSRCSCLDQGAPYGARSPLRLPRRRTVDPRKALARDLRQSADESKRQDPCP